MGLPGIDNKWHVKRHGRFKGHHMSADQFRVARKRVCGGESTKCGQGLEWKFCMTWIASFSKPLKGLCSLQILLF